MSFLFGRGKKSPAELVRNTKAAILVFSDAAETDEKAFAKVRCTANIPSFLFLFYSFLLIFLAKDRSCFSRAISSA